jgi:hypothetical protein
METVVLFALMLFAAVHAPAQPPATLTADPSNKTVTLTGCVGGGTESQPITLSQALIVPAGSEPAAGNHATSPEVSAPATEPSDATLPPAGAAAVPAPTPVGTSGTKTSASTRTASSGVVTGTAPAGSSRSSVTGYRLSGVDMQPWIGKRVQVIGMFAPAPAAASGATQATAPKTTIAAPVLEFKVQSVQPATGPCR